jgi:glycosyltransferase involved in cell wall biosynthesis
MRSRKFRPMSRPSVAVVIPVLNRPTEVVEALNSVAAQTLLPTRVIVVDDGSTDDTAQRVQQWIDGKKLACELKLVRQSNAGVSSARNRGAAEAGDCELLAFLDSDDLWPPDYLQRMVESFERRPDAAAASCDRVTVIIGSDRSAYRSEKRIENDTTATIFCDRPPTPSHTVMRTKTFQALGGYDRSLLAGEEDLHLALRLSMSGPWLYVPGAPVTKRNHTSRVTGGDPSLLTKRADSLFLRTQMLSRFIHEEGGAAVVPKHKWQRRLADLWYRSGRILRKLGRTQDAAQCFQRARSLRSWHLRAQLQAWLSR